MKIKGIIFEDFINYKKPCMTIETSKCDFKCDRECGKRVCQNSALATAPDIEIKIENLISHYLNNPITQAIVFQGLEPFDTFDDIADFVFLLRSVHRCYDPIIIYTGYMEKELEDQLSYLKLYKNIIIKVGRFIPNQTPHYDELLGVNLASNNQYAKRIS